ncbi:MAG: exonuclease SbcCD subunit D [Chloroflexi bacterium]|nr:exonuclease SbcCD subunit D [Chloroflexota bacterium]
MSIKLLHFADVHIGMENYGRVDSRTGISSRVMDLLRRLNEIIAFAEENDADLAIFAGDAFKTRSPNPTFQREFARRIRRLADQCPVVLLVGNHDIPTMTGKASTVEIFETLGVDNVYVGSQPRVFWIETKAGPVQVGTMPYPVRQRLLADINTRGMNLNTLDELLREQVGVIINDLAQQVQQYPDIPAILTGHFTVQGAKLSSERGVMLGRDVAVLTSTVADPAWDYVALGHIHYHQDMNAAAYPPVVYSGSIERIDFGEEKDPKGFCWVEIERGATNYEFIEVAARPFVTIRADVRGHTDPMSEILNQIRRYDVRDSVVRVIIKATPEVEPKLTDRDITNALEGCAYIAAIQRDIEHPVRARLGVENVEGLSAVELLDMYLRKNDLDDERIQVLTEYAEDLIYNENLNGRK